jgi:hypothetical protein
LLLTLFLLLMPCYFQGHVGCSRLALPYHCTCYPAIVLCCHLAITPCSFLFQVPPRPPFPLLFCCIIILLLRLATIPSSLSCASGGAWSNTNKLHPIEVFFFQILFFLCFVFCLLCLFVCKIKIQTFDLNLKPFNLNIFFHDEMKEECE